MNPSLRLPAVLLCFALALFLLFWRLGTVPVSSWDEARYGGNAVEMTRSGDYVNYHFRGQLDLWNAKPPLQVWLIAGANRLFGENEFSLRLPSAIAGLLTLMVIFAWGWRAGGPTLACLFLLLGTLNRALIGYHVARSGDMDALFVLGLAVFSFALFWLLEEKREDSFAWVMVFLGLAIAFMAKGFAFLLVGPGALWVVRRSLRRILTSRRFWISSLVFFVTVAVWLGTLSLHGKSNPQSDIGPNAAAVMVFYDIFGRFFGGMNAVEEIEPFLVFMYMDVRFLALYHALILLLILAWWKRRAWKTPPARTVFFHDVGTRDRMFDFSVALSLSVFVLLALSKNKINWYIAPLVIWMPVLIMTLVDRLATISRRWKIAALSLLALALLVNLVHQVKGIIEASPSTSIARFVRDNRESLHGARRITVNKILEQSEYLYLRWSSHADIIETGSFYEDGQFRGLTCQEGDCQIIVLPPEQR
ncbi:MAG: glycosyltransferase family 39 protein [Bdellovibrionaceae bacterium]|nr:glycosyltransferase family 39 protein [Pseudobdellovibrionaceae bacterium]MBX3035033.1 glycosyltransferase family 39 protein [Pseudobdellovibrionaceae bacterium]